MVCAKCGKEFPAAARSRAGISIFVMGDEYIYSYWYCEECQHYTVRAYHDRFMGEDSEDTLPPMPKERGDRAVALIRACPQPFDKYCECPSHRAMYYGVPGDGASGKPSSG